MSFFLDYVEYYFEEGMTWRQWLESDYNVDGYILDISESEPDYFICKPGVSGRKYIYGNGNFIRNCDVIIIKDKEYHTGEEA